MSGKFALIIGNTQYTDPGLAQLTAPGKDAEDFARIIKDQNICAFDEVKILLNQLSSSVIEAIDEFFDQRKPDDLLVLYFSGHGVRDELGSLYLAFKNTIRSRLRSTAIKSDYIRDAMDQSRSKRQVLILDCCNSGAFPQGTKAEVGGAMGMMTAFQGYGRYVLTASDATQYAWEGDKVIGSETENSLFTYFLIKGLEGDADSEGDGKITVDKLYDYAFEQVSKVTPKQTPTKSSSKAEGEIILRQITRIEDIKPISLPEELIEATQDSRTFVREGAVQQLAKYLNGKNLGLARSAREALEQIEKDDDSRRVVQAASQILAPIRKQELEEEQRIEQIARSIVRDATRTASDALGSIREEESNKLVTRKVEEQRLKREREELQQQIASRAADQQTTKPIRFPLLAIGMLSVIAVGIVLCGFVVVRFLPSIIGSTITPTAQISSPQDSSVIGNWLWYPDCSKNSTILILRQDHTFRTASNETGTWNLAGDKSNLTISIKITNGSVYQGSVGAGSTTMNPEDINNPTPGAACWYAFKQSHN
jgi:hypothetical protein